MDNEIYIVLATVSQDEFVSPDDWSTEGADVIVYRDGDKMFHTGEQATALVEEMTKLYPSMDYRKVPVQLQ